MAPLPQENEREPLMTADPTADPETRPKRDYRPTVFLPRTDFPMRAGLAKKEPEILARWQEMDLYRRLRQQSAGRPPYVLHDGPPYANGNIHIGTGLNKILKDMVVRSRQMTGYDANYVPGWDCHGLPIEWQIEERYRAVGKSKDDVSLIDLRRECRTSAERWIAVQSDEFQRLGVIGDWDQPYLTMTFAAEAQIVREIHKFLLNGGLYKGLKPVMWSVVEKTALAEAEVEYRDYVSTTVMARFPVVEAGHPALAGASLVIWTTTPWTLPANQALAYGEAIDYGVWRVDAVADGSTVAPGTRLVLAADLADSVREAAGITAWRAEATLPGSALAGTICAHPLAAAGDDAGSYGDRPVPALPGDFVTTEQGTGVVHIAPSHGDDDYELGRAHGLALLDYVDDDGSYKAHVPLFAGKRIYTADGKAGDANPAVVAALAEAGTLVARGRLNHTYPHSWRSKAPVIFRATPQWFISMQTNGLRERALAALAQTQFHPAAGYARLSSMIEHRPDWCISRQRAWGVPIALFVHKTTGEPLADPAVLDRIAEIFAAEGSDAWFARPAGDFLGNDHQADDYAQVFDIVDVWFESGSTHAFVLEQRDDLTWPAALYLEGSDQHRGWFHSSLLEACGTRGRAPYDAVLTHGFVLDEQGRKMSKSLGNTVSPQDVANQHGADILRLWVAGSDYSQDVRIGPEILKLHADAYRRLRNTLRYLLGAVADFTDAERLDRAAMPELERYVLHRTAEIDRDVRAAIERYDFPEMARLLHNYCANDLSAFYLDIRKDVLYCDAADSPRRRAARTVMSDLLDCLTVWLAPILCFTAEEAWTARRGAAAGSVHEQLFATLPADWLDTALGTRWAAIREVRRVITGALELERAEKRIGAALQAHPVVHVDATRHALLDGLDLAEIAITSAATVSTAPAPADAFRLADVDDVAVVPGLAAGRRCERCWRVLEEVGTRDDYDDLCGRCADVVAGLVAADPVLAP